MKLLELVGEWQVLELERERLLSRLIASAPSVYTGPQLTLEVVEFFFGLRGVRSERFSWGEPGLPAVRILDGRGLAILPYEGHVIVAPETRLAAVVDQLPRLFPPK